MSNGDTRKANLAQLLSKEPAPLEQVLPYFIKTLLATEEGHASGKNHHYLSPQKIRFTGDGKAQVPTSTVNTANATVVFSSPKYSAPESFEQSTNAFDCRSHDSYVLGFMFYEILLGSKLFTAQFGHVQAQGEFAWLVWHLDKAQPAKPLVDLIKGFPHTLSTLIDGMIVKDPARRTTDLNVIIRTLVSGLQATRVFNDPASVRIAGPASDAPSSYGSQHSLMPLWIKHFTNFWNSARWRVHSLLEPRRKADTRRTNVNPRRVMAHRFTADDERSTRPL